MRAAFIIISAIVFIGCASLRQGASLTSEQATSLAIRLANDKAFTLFHCRPFRDGQSAHFTAGRWNWTSWQGYGQGDVQATVKFAADGSAQQVEVEFFDNRLMITP